MNIDLACIQGVFLTAPPLKNTSRKKIKVFGLPPLPTPIVNPVKKVLSVGIYLMAGGGVRALY